MPAHKLFAAVNDMDLSGISQLAAVKTNRSKDAEALSPNNTTGYAKLHRDVARAMLNIFGVNGMSDNTLYGNYAMVETSGVGCYAAELAMFDGSRNVVTYNANTGDIRAAKIRTTGAYTNFDPFGGRNDNVDKTVIFLAIIAYLYQNVEHVKTRIDDPGKTLNMFYVSDVIETLLNDGTLKVNIPQNGNIDLLSKSSVEAGVYNGKVIKGVPTVLLGTKSGRASAANLTMSEAKAEFAEFIAAREASGKVWTDEEREFIPKFPDQFKVPPEALKIARRYVRTTDSTRPMRNFMWRGITSYGKSTGVEALAAMLDIPLLRITCHSTMETQNFLSDFVPDTDSFTAQNLPSFEEITMDPESAYYQLTGESDPDATAEMCLHAYGEAYAKAYSTGPRFKHVISNYVKALVNGYIIEVQECSRIKDSGVLVGLNEYDKPGAVIPLIDGTYAHRDKNAIVIYTDNVGYVSCRPIDPSVIRRTAFIIDSTDLSKSTIISRIKYNTGYTDEEVLENAYQVWKLLKDYAKEHDIAEGCISVNELEMFIQVVQCDGLTEANDAVVECIISKATSDPDEQNELKTFFDANKSKYKIF